MTPAWYKLRGYKHFDVPISETYACALADDPDRVAKHSWLPLIHYVKQTRRYKPLAGKTVSKDRDIMYASHKDSCIFSRYCHILNEKLEAYYKAYNISQNVIAYRKIGNSNYHFSAEAYNFCVRNIPCVVLCFDVTGFFDNLDHKILKEKLKRLLGVSELTSDWYSVFRQATRYYRIERKELESHPVFGPRLTSSKPEPIGRIADIRAAGIMPKPNSSPGRGIPQGTPISAAFSNLYMIDLDKEMSHLCLGKGALYRRYSDDILVACKAEDESHIVSVFFDLIENQHLLEIKKEKTERALFRANGRSGFQYLGFNISPRHALLRPGSVSRQWRKLRRAIRKAELAAKKSEGEHGKKPFVYTKKLRARFTSSGIKNFSSYSRRSAAAFESKSILRQARKLERAADGLIRSLNL